MAAAVTTIAKRQQSTSVNLIGQLISGAESLLSEYYPSTIISDIATLTWPSVVTIDGVAYTVPVTSISSSTLQTSVLSVSSTPSSSTSMLSVTSAPAVQTPSSTTSTASSTTTSSLSLSSVEAIQTSSTSTTTSAPTSSATQAPNSDGMISNTSSGIKVDRRLGIGLGVTLGLIALGLIFFLLFCLRRRKRNTGSYQKYGAQLPDDSEIDSWKTNANTRYQTHIWSDKDAPFDYPTPSMAMLNAPPPIATAGMRHNSGTIGSSQRSWHTPYSGPAELAGSRSLEYVPLAASAQQSNQSFGPEPRRHRPTTPLVHTAMRNNQSRAELPEYADNPISPVSPRQATYTSLYETSNPFWSPDDFEASRSYHRLSETRSRPSTDNHDPLPPPPPRSPQRRNSPQIHYPSGTEISNFDFGLKSHQLEQLRHAGEDGHVPVSYNASQQYRY